MENKVLNCEICGAAIAIDEEYYSVNVQLEKMDSRRRVFRGEEFPLYSVCSRCAGDVLLKGMVLSKDNKVSLSSEEQKDN